MKLRAFLLVAIFATSIMGYGQDKEASPTAVQSIDASSSNLNVAETTTVPLNGALFEKARCDDDGNIYARILDDEIAKQRNAVSKVPIRKIRPDGSMAGTFRINDAAQDLYARDFFVTGDGRVYVETWKPSDSTVYILEFASDGSLASTIRIDAEPFGPRQIVVFKTGEFLLSGTLGQFGHTPFTAVFDSNGKLIKKIYEPEDEYARVRAEADDPNFVREGTNWDNTAVSHGDAALGSDGNAYLLRAASPALIYVISSKGELIRKLQIDSPSSGLIARGLKSARGKLAISFLETDSTIGVIKVVDSLGNPVGSHISNDQTIFPGLPGCYNSHSFVFLHAGGQNKVTLQRAEPK